MQASSHPPLCSPSFWHSAGTSALTATVDAAPGRQSKRAAIVEESPFEAARAVGGPVDADLSAVAQAGSPGPQHIDDSAPPTVCDCLPPKISLMLSISPSATYCN